MRLKIAMAHHKTPKDGDPALRDSRYIHIGTGEARSCPTIHHDNDGEDNIAELNYTFCELTHLYWLWKHLDELIDEDTEYIGLCHYRRRFDLNSLEGMLEVMKPDIVCSAPAPIGVYDIRHQYWAAHNKEDFELMLGHIKESFVHQKNPYITDAWLGMRLLPAPYNCVVMRKELFKDWCNRMFAVLLDIYNKRKADIQTRDKYQQRAMGFLGERFTSWYVSQMACGLKKNVVAIGMEKTEGAI